MNPQNTSERLSGNVKLDKLGELIASSTQKDNNQWLYNVHEGFSLKRMNSTSWNVNDLYFCMAFGNNSDLTVREVIPHQWQNFQEFFRITMKSKLNILYFSYFIVLEAQVFLGNTKQISQKQILPSFWLVETKTHFMLTCQSQNHLNVVWSFPSENVSRVFE